MSWNAVSVAAGYRVYRNGTLVGTTTSTSFVDSGLAVAGSYTYTVTSVSALNIESPASNGLVVAYTTGPIVTNTSVSPGTVSVGQTAVLSATITADVAAVVAAEYFEGADPGEGHGVAMALSGSTASATLPGTLSVGSHGFTVRGRDSLGNWTRGGLGTAQLTVTLPALNGRILNGANQGIAGVQINVIDPVSHAIVASTTSNGAGNYSVSVSPGIYDVVYTPPGTTYLPTTKTGINLNVSATVDVVLVLQPTTFSGKVKDKNGQAIAGASLTMRNQGGQTFTTTSAADGTFAVSVNPASYSVTISGTRAAAPQAFVPTSFTLTGGAFDLTGDVYQEFTISASTITFTTRSALTLAPIGQAVLNVSTSTDTTVYPGSGSYTGGSGYTVATDNAGVAAVVVLDGTRYTVTALPPPNSGVVATLFPQAGPVNGDIAVNLDLTADIKHFSGVFLDRAGSAIAGATVRLTGPLGSFQTVTSATGAFEVEAAAGIYSLTVSGSRPSGSALPIPDSYGFSGGTINISVADVTKELRLVAETVTVTAQSPFGSALAGVTIQLNSVPGNAELYPGGTFAAIATSTKTTDANGVAVLYVTKDLAYTTKATPPAGSGYLVTNLPASSPVTGPAAWTVTLQRDLKTFTAVVKDKLGTAIEGATVALDGNEQDQHYSAVTNSLGAVTLNVAPNGNYSLRVNGTQAGSPAALLPDNYLLSTTTSVTADKTQNVTVTAVELDVLARDDRLAPIPGVAIVFSSSGSQNGFAASSSAIGRTTNGTGHAQLRMLAGTTYTINAVPPPGLGYLNTTFNGTSPIAQDAQTIIEFQNQIPPPPTGLTAPSPTKTSPALTWNPVVNADHYNIYRGTTNIGTSSTTSFTDTGLSTDGNYPYRVSAVSAAGYEGPKSTAANVVYDTTAPIVGDPQLSVNPKQVGQSSELSATVSDGAGAGVGGGEYFIGTADPGEGNAIAMTLSGATLVATIGTGLSAGTYPIGLRAKDVLGTWSTVRTITLTVSRPLPPSALSAPSPTNGNPVLSWTASADAVKYRVYRDGIRLTAEPTATTYTDPGQGNGIHSYSVTAVNAFGDESDHSNTVTVLIDRIAPTIHPTAAPGPNGHGWNNTSVVVTFSCDDDSSGVDTCTAPITLSGQGANQTATGTVTDRAGNTASATTMPINIDLTNPAITHTVSPAPNAAGWHNTNVTVSFACSDVISLVASCSAPIVVTGEGAAQTVTGTAIDNADNSSSDPVTVKIDKTAPVLGMPAWSVNPMPLNGSTTLTVPVTDNLSGVAVGEYYLDSDPGVGNGIPMTLSGNTLTKAIGAGLAVGVYSVGIRARDVAGNWSQAGTTMLVVYDPGIPIGITGKNKKDLIPRLANGDVLPGLTGQNQNDAAEFGFTVDYANGVLDPRNDFMLTYQAGGHSLSLSATGFAWLIIDQTNNSRGRFQGTATLIVDGVSTTNPFTVEGIDGDRLPGNVDDHVTVKVFAPGANPATAAALYQASGSITKGNAVRIR
ncbi:beta strand repeat-containing protein [Rhizocola hellebori]|uniref:beta strand repeat-containing protein n=1 Tax=Rhizocola hellebori TaxID=1392758 RepID=UPI001941F89C|nr:carboxypeptidase-like regulatory domain-containing protein [Rhizocola hellebori]